MWLMHAATRLLYALHISAYRGLSCFYPFPLQHSNGGHLLIGWAAAAPGAAIQQMYLWFSV